jgi:hypothetical protein
MAPPSLRSTPDRNSSKQITTRKRYTDLEDSGGLNRQKLYIKTKSREETGTEKSFRVLSHLGGAARGGPVPPMCEEHTDSFSYPFLSCDFSYLVKIAKILKERAFRETSLTRTVTYSKMNSAGTCNLSWMNSSGETISITSTSSL